MMKGEEKIMKGSVHEENFFMLHGDLVLMEENKIITWMKENNYFHCWLLPTNGFQDGTAYDGIPIDNCPKFLHLDNSLNIDIWHSLHFHCALIRFVIDSEGNDKEERIILFSLYTSKEICRGLKRIWEPKMGTPYSARIIQDVDLTLKVLENFYCANGAEVEGLDDRNGHRRKVVGE